MIELYGVTNIKWVVQIQLAKKLLSRYSFNEIDYALRYYKSKGVQLYSLGYLLATDVMKDAVDLYKAEQTICLQDGNSGDRNKQKCIRKDNETNIGKEHYFNMFEESE